MDKYIKNFYKINRINYSNDSWLEQGKIPSIIQINEEEYQKLWDSHPLEKHRIFIFNKYHLVPRWQQAYGKNYKFSGNVAKAKKITNQLKKYLDWANDNELKRGRSNNLNGILVNWYKNGDDYIGWHSDDETQLDKNSSIYTISLGSERTFKIREKKNKLNVNKFTLENNDFLIMGGNFQKYYQHHLPKTKKCKSSRISITLRSFKN